MLSDEIGSPWRARSKVHMRGRESGSHYVLITANLGIEDAVENSIQTGAYRFGT
jgi:hypothetical protein